jgi:predicted transposase YbfD/YdcC
VITADALHCQKTTARAIVEKGGDDLLQLKANQPSALQFAKSLTADISPLLSN